MRSLHSGKTLLSKRGSASVAMTRSIAPLHDDFSFALIGYPVIPDGESVLIGPVACSALRRRPTRVKSPLLHLIKLRDSSILDCTKKVSLSLLS
jgi:hypothetical protein